MKIENEKQLAKYFDHTILKPFASQEEIIAICEEAKEMQCAMVAINSYPVSDAKNYLKGSGVHVGAAISFPLGQTTIPVKVFEVKEAIFDGADEIDYVINISKVKDQDYDYIKDEMQQIVNVCKEHYVLCKVIFETCYLTLEEIEKVALIAKEVKPDFIKTSTGFGTNGATFEHVELMVKTVDGACQVKAAGGVRDWVTCKKMIELGATRIGTSSSKIILEQFKKEQEV